MPRHSRDPDYVGVTVLVLSLLFGSVFLMSLAGGALAQQTGASATNPTDPWRIDPSPDAVAAGTRSVTLIDRVVAQIPVLLDLPGDQLRIVFSAADAAAMGQDASVWSVQIEPVGLPTLGPLPLRVQAYSDGQQVLRLKIRPTVQQRVTAVTALRPLSRGTVVAASDVLLQTQWLDRQVDEPHEQISHVIGRQVTRPIGQGDIVTAERVEPVTLINGGDHVTLRCRTGRLIVQLRGRAMQDGGAGETIKVRSDRLRQTYVATVTGPGEVTINTQTNTDGRP